MNVGQFQTTRKVDVVTLDLLEHRLVVADDIHLVDRHDDVLDAQQRHDERMPLCLGEDAVPRVDENDGEVGRRGPRGHIPGVLLVAGGVGDDELSLVGREVAICDVDRDPLLPLVLQPVGEQREVDLLAGRAVSRRILLDRRELVLVDHLRLIEEPADERALAVVNAPAGDEAEEFLPLMLGEVFVDVRGDQG